VTLSIARRHSHGSVLPVAAKGFRNLITANRVIIGNSQLYVIQQPPASCLVTCGRYKRKMTYLLVYNTRPHLQHTESETYFYNLAIASPFYTGIIIVGPLNVKCKSD